MLYMETQCSSFIFVHFILFFNVAVIKYCDNKSKESFISLMILGYGPLLRWSQGRDVRFHIHNQEQSKNNHRTPPLLVCI